MHRAAKHRRKAKFVAQPREESRARPFMIITLGTIRSMRSRTSSLPALPIFAIGRLIVGVVLPICYPLRTDDAATKIRSRHGSKHKDKFVATQC